MYEPGRFTAKDLPKGPKGSNQPWDPVYAQHAFQLVTGPLKRKQNTTPDDHLTVDELEKWMDAASAAKVLGIKEHELPTLTPPVLEQYWAKAYSERTNAMQQETVIAAEVLLEYIDSSLYRKKSRQYYRQYMDNARHSIDNEAEMWRSEHRQKFIHLFGFLMFTACALVICLALCRDILTRQDVAKIGNNAITYLNMVLTQPSNPEPAPDYSTRYRDTPVAMEIDQLRGAYGQTDPVRYTSLVEGTEQYRRQEEAEMLQMLNDENERAIREAKTRRARESRVLVYREEDFDDDGKLKEAGQSAAEMDPATAFSQLSFRQFANLIASQFGGGSRFQRITQNSVKRAEEIEKMRKRMSEVE
ncbi:hypothetical protein ERJ75_001234900 [Trypanosoma vivax]|nr:hypothetical protein ERJ75_001234900 [Trypanosoma vivax]